VLPLGCERKKLQNLSHFKCGLKICQIWIQLITVCGNIAREDAQNTHHWSGAIDDAADEWPPQWRNDPAWPTSLLVAVSVYPNQWWVFCNRPTRCNQRDSNLANLEATFEVRQWRRWGGGPPRVTSSGRWHPNEIQNIFVAEFTRTPDKWLPRKVERVAVCRCLKWSSFSTTMTKKSSLFEVKKRWHHQLPHQVTPALVTLLRWDKFWSFFL